MSSIIKRLDKRTGITYVYESTSYWDKEKKQPRSKRVLIGKLDPDTGKVVPTDGRGKRRKERLQRESDTIPAKQGPVPALRTERVFYGATYLFDQIGELTGVRADLKTCFPDTYKQILSIAYYLILEDENPLYRFSKWAKLHRHPYGKDISSQRSSELFQSITEEQKMKFFRLQGERRSEKEYWAYETTSISSYSETLRQVKYGKNKDGDCLPQINLAILFGEESSLPFYYRKLAGNIPDIKTIRELIRELDILGYSKAKLVIDRGFCSTDNINALYKNHYKFLLGASTTLKYAKDFIREIGDTKDYFEFYDSDFDLYVFSKTIAWNYEQQRPYKGDTIHENRRMYLHLYYNPEKQVDDAKNFNRSVSATYRQDKIDQAHERYGFFVLLSNEVKDPITALKLYRMRDVAEKAFWNYKDRLNLRRTLTSSESSLEGKLFVEFVALIYLSYINKKMTDGHLYSKYTMHELLDELDVIECYLEPGKAPVQGEILTKQEQLYRDLGVNPLLARPKQ